MSNSSRSLISQNEERSHRASVEVDIAQIASFLQENLGSRVTALIGKVTDSREVGRWASGEHRPRPPSEQRLRVAYQVFHLVQSAESPHTVRAWFVGLNPQLDDTSPAEAIASDRHRDVLAAARAFVAGG